jgi:hypothetical protein
MPKKNLLSSAAAPRDLWCVRGTRWRDPGDHAHIGKVLVDEDAETREAAQARAKQLIDELAPVVDKRNWITVDLEFHPSGAPASEVAFRTYVPTQDAIDAAIEIGLVGDVAYQIMSMAANSALYKNTHPWATHRYGRFVMIIEENRVTRFDVMGPPEPTPPRRRPRRR